MCGNVFEKEINFYIQKVVATSYTKVEEPNITLKLGDELDFALTEIVPVYASVDFDINFQNNLGVLSQSGTKVVANNVGNEVVVVSIDGETFEYAITVIERHNTNVSITQQQTSPKYLVGLELEDGSASVVAVKLDGRGVEFENLVGVIIIEDDQMFSEIELTLSFSGEEVVKIVEVDWE